MWPTFYGSYNTYIHNCMYNYKKKEGKLDKIRKILGYTYKKAKVEKNEKWNRGSFKSNQKMGFSLSMDKGSSYVILFHYQPWIDLIDPIFIILNWFSIIRMQVLPLNLQDTPFSSLWDYIPSYCEKKKIKRLWKSIFSHLLLLHCSF